MRCPSFPAAALLCLGALATAGRAQPVELLKIEAHAAGTRRCDAVLDIALDANTLRAVHGVLRPLSAESLLMTEVSMSGKVIDRAVAFQLAPAAAGPGRLTFLAKGATAAGATRHFRLHVRKPGRSMVPRKTTPLVEVSDDFEDEGQCCFRITAPSATWYYHRRGAGFSSLEDANGHDWIGYSEAKGSAGEYRGIPNLVHPEGHFHPGGTKCTTRLLASGPLKAVLESRSQDDKWAVRWEITPAWARLTVLQADHPYWFLYEGTPGGKLEPGTDACLRSDGTRAPAAKRWTGDLPGDAGIEWACFSDASCPFGLFVAHLADDEAVDSYWPMQGNMTVFGFGRKGLSKHLTGAGRQFMVGFVPAGEDDKAVAAAVAARVRPWKVTLSPVRGNP